MLCVVWLPVSDFLDVLVLFFVWLFQGLTSRLCFDFYCLCSVWGYVLTLYLVILFFCGWSVHSCYYGFMGISTRVDQTSPMPAWKRNVSQLFFFQTCPMPVRTKNVSQHLMTKPLPKMHIQFHSIPARIKNISKRVLKHTSHGTQNVST